VTKKKQKPTAFLDGSQAQKHAMQAIQEFVCWHICAIGMRSPSRGLEVGTATAIRWHQRIFLLTADHVIRDVPDAELDFAFRPPGTLPRFVQGQGNSSPKKYVRAQQVQVVHRYRSPTEDLAALEVHPEVQNRVEFFDLRPESKVIRPLGSSICTIGVPSDSFEQLAPSACAFSFTVHWGELVTRGQKLLRDFNPRKHLLLRFPPADEGRHPGGFSGAGAWYQAPSAEPPIVWTFRPVLAGIVTHFYRTSRVLQIARIERVVAFLRDITKTESS
jgi:hypothetical protein